MTSVLVQVKTKLDAENALAELWLQVELHHLSTPHLLIEFDDVSQITFRVTIDGPAPAGRTLRAWSEVYGGICLGSLRSVDRSTRETVGNAINVADIRSAIGPITVPDYDCVTLGSCEVDGSGLSELGASICRQTEDRAEG
jgi:hypothetical protein